MKVRGSHAISFIELETNLGAVHQCGNQMGGEFYEFEIPEGYKVVSFSGVIESKVGECKIINLSSMIKEIYEDCETAEETISFRDFNKNYYQTFNIFKTKDVEDIKRIKEVRLFAGKDPKRKDLDNKACDCIGGIDIVYETADGEEVEDGLIDLACKNINLPPVVLELKENECKNTLL